VSSRLNDSLLETFMSTFYGYGEFGSRVQPAIWFVGIEEGGGAAQAEIQQRLDLWSARGGEALEDLREYHLALGATAYFQPPVSMQPTWSKLVRLFLTLNHPGAPASLDDVKRYQSESFGRRGGETALLELFPLPSPSLRTWLYPKFSKLEYLQTRSLYAGTIGGVRAANLSRQIRTLRPRAIIFYGVAAAQWWANIAVQVFQPDEKIESLWTARTEHTLFAIVRHPVSRGATNEYFYNTGVRLNALLNR
jgi:hypothetical protein